MTEKPVRILFVCTGNTCRSPTAEWMTRWLLENSPATGKLEVKSAGLAASPGAPLSEHARRLLEDKLGRKVEHSARQLTDEMIRQSDWVFTMTSQHRDAVLSLVNGKEDRIALLQEFAGQSGDIPDPYGGSLQDYQRMVETVEQAVKVLVAKIGMKEQEDEDCPGQ